MKQSIIRINLMAHREAKREAGKKEFILRGVLTALLACALVFLAATVIGQAIESQRQRNEFITAKIKVMDAQIAEIATLQSEIDALKARQKAVEDLQSDRNLPVYLFDEMVRYVPEGVHLRSLKQDGLKVSLIGIAQTQERVSEVLRNFSNASQWVESPELSEIKSIAGSRPNEKLFEFTLTVMLKRQSKTTDKVADKPALKPGLALPPPKP